jgi:hypothetical protein
VPKEVQKWVLKGVQKLLKRYSNSTQSGQKNSSKVSQKNFFFTFSN